MKIAFLVTYYNQEAYVSKSLDSILAVRKPDDWEILIGDDGSSDATVDRVQDYISRDPEHIFLYRMPRDPQKNYDSVKRASQNRLNLLAHSDADCFCILDGDDYYVDRDFAMDAVSILEDHPEVSAVAFGYRMDVDGTLQESHQLLPDGEKGQLDKQAFLRRMYTPGGACVHRRGWSKERLNELVEIGYFDDNDIVLNSLRYGEIYAVGRTIYAYRQTGQSLYNSMHMVEQSILNTQGMDVDIRIMGPEYEDILLIRYGSFVLTMYEWRKQIKNLIPADKYERYLESCRSFTHSYLEDLLEYTKLTREKRTELKKTLCYIRRNLPKDAVKAKMKYLLLRNCKE